MAFKTGSRLIISGVADERSTRTFFVQRNTEVPAYFAGAWSHRSPPNADEAAHIQQSMPTTPGARLEAVCTIEADGEVILTDLLYSAPKL
ncbi:MAG: hypothetical protein H6895_08720 [Defluviimonas sp.]|uniref:hypothetical protein n=1 Tax=Albidovulum sp. TaxID=1872424 RepID=UPI001D356E77|nr:hypothetical protein [Paracoccaceae bacterium]MCC0064156.1 hypothetical protein [Defluviimonas sp.]